MSGQGPDSGTNSGTGPGAASTLREHVTRILQFGTIKVMPGLAGLVLVPLLYQVMGAEGYGIYSVLQSAGLLMVTVLSAVLTQPMYRFLSSRIDEDMPAFNAIALGAAATAGVASGVAGWIYGGSALFALPMALFGVGGVLFGAYGVICQIRVQVARLALIEAARVALMLGLVAVMTLMLDRLQVIHAVWALALSYALPALPYLLGLRLAWPHWDWAVARLGYGLKGAGWLAMAGLPFLVSKLVVGALAPAPVLGAFSAIADLFYRVFAMLNAAVVMSVFPALSREYDAGRLGLVRRIYALGLGVYLVGGALALAGAGAALWLGIGTGPVAEMGLTAAALVLLATLSWQILSIVHKKGELLLRMNRVLLNMVAALLVFAGVAGLAIWSGMLEPVLALPLAIMASAGIYTVASLAFSLDGA